MNELEKKEIGYGQNKWINIKRKNLLIEHTQGKSDILGLIQWESLC